MADVQVTCIIKPDKNSRHEHITHLGGENWLWPRKDVIDSIDNKTNTFYVLDQQNNRRSNIGVVRSTGQDPYLRTYADGVWNNNLLSLDQCSR